MQARNMVRFMRGGFYALLRKGSLTDIAKEINDKKGPLGPF